MSGLLLTVNELSVAYGRIQAVKNLSLEIARGELVTLIGSNGAGKTSTLKAIAGLLKAPKHSICYKDKPIDALPAYQRVGLGIALVPEGRGVFTRMTTLENLQMGAYKRSDKTNVLSDIARMFDLFPRLKERREQLAGTMSGGEQQMLAIARALMSQPELLLLDEPSMGLSPIMVEKVFEVIKDVRQQGITVLLVEQNANLALKIADRGYVMDSGELLLHGQASDLLTDQRVKQAYLGQI
jgi:branched-chain amino acid transport system ATP-binding protein